MKTIQTEIKLYSYDELKGDSKEKAFESHFNFLCDNPTEYENEMGEMVYSEEEPIKEDVEDSIRINEYWFFENGEMADCVTYTGKHKKAGITEFNFQGKTYNI